MTGNFYEKIGLYRPKTTINPVLHSKTYLAKFVSKFTEPLAKLRIKQRQPIHKSLQTWYAISKINGKLGKTSHLYFLDE